MKVKLSNSLKDYVRNFESMEDAAKKLDVSASTLYALLADDRSPSSEFIAKVIEVIGWDFEKAFDVVEEPE